MPPENLSYISQETQDSEATLVNQENVNTGHIDNYLQNSGMGLGDYDQNQGNWLAPGIDSFAGEGNWTNYTTAPQEGGQQWEGDAGMPFENHMGPRMASVPSQRV